MKKLFLGLMILVFTPKALFSQGGFFDDSSPLEENQDTQTEEISPPNTSSDKNSSEEPQETPTTEDKPEHLDSNTIQDTQKDVQNTIILGDRVKIRVNNVILTERQLSIFFALRKLSSFLSKMNTIEEVQEEMKLVLGLEVFAKTNNLYNLLPTRNEMDKRIDFLNNSTKSKSLAETVLKIDPSGNLSANDIRQFFYYQILREKGFVYALQQEFMNKMFTPRDDEILLLYKQVLLSDPKIFQTSAQLYVMNITVVEPVNDAKKNQLIKALQKVREAITKELDLAKKEKLFLAAIKKYSSAHLRSTNVIGPLDETLIDQDFPEYKELFNLKVGGVSDVFDQDGFVRLVFIKQKDDGKISPVSNPDIRQRIIGIIYDTKGNILFHSFLENNLRNFDVEIMDQKNDE